VFTPSRAVVESASIGGGGRESGGAIV